jgi:hypothetical protein
LQAGCRSGCRRTRFCSGSTGRQIEVIYSHSVARSYAGSSL